MDSDLEAEGKADKLDGGVQVKLGQITKVFDK